MNGNDAIPHNGYMGGYLEHLSQTVCNIDDTNSLGAQIGYAPEKAFHLVKGQGGGGLIQNQELGVAQ